MYHEELLRDNVRHHGERLRIHNDELEELRERVSGLEQRETQVQDLYRLASRIEALETQVQDLLEKVVALYYKLAE